VVPGITSIYGVGIWDDVSGSAIATLDYTSTVPGAPTALNSTATGTQQWYRYWQATNTIQSFMPSSATLSGIYTNYGVIDWGGNTFFVADSGQTGVRTYNAASGAEGTVLAMNTIMNTTGQGWINGVGAVSAGSAGSGAGVPTAGVKTNFATAVVGYPYLSQGQTLRPISPDDTGAKAGPGFAKTRRSHVVGMLLHNTIGLQFGTSFTGSQLQPAVLKGGQDGNTGTQLAPNEMFSGHYRRPLIDDYSYDSMLAWQITRPYPASVVNIGAFIETQDV
jgi:hypothetical protein